MRSGSRSLGLTRFLLFVAETPSVLLKGKRLHKRCSLLLLLLFLNLEVETHTLIWF